MALKSAKSTTPVVANGSTSAMQKRSLTSLILSLSLVLGSSVSAEEGATRSLVNEKPTVKVGAILSFSGGLEQWCHYVRQGIELAASEAGEVNLQVVFEDDHSIDKTKTLTAAQKLVEVDNVDVLFSWTASTVPVLASVATKSKTPLLPSATLSAESLSAEMHKVDVDGIGEKIGTVTFDSENGKLHAKIILQGLPPGERGFHIHQHGSCAPAEKNGKMSAAEAAGGHYDPDTTAAHRGPEGHGHKGDLPRLVVNDKGEARVDLLVPRLTLDDLKGRAVIIHGVGDNYSDAPAPLGGGGARIACGMVE